MARSRNHKIKKLQRYRDKLLQLIADLRGEIREHKILASRAQRELANDNNLRAYAILSGGRVEADEIDAMDKSQLITELTLVYKFLITERETFKELMRAAEVNDMLRLRALAAQIDYDISNHERIIGEVSLKSVYMRQAERDVRHERNSKMAK